MIISKDTRKRKRIQCRCRVCNQKWVVSKWTEFYICPDCENGIPKEKNMKSLVKQWRKRGLIK